MFTEIFRTNKHHILLGIKKNCPTDTHLAAQETGIYPVVQSTERKIFVLEFPMGTQ